MRKRTLRIIALVFALTLLMSTAALAAMNASAYINATSAWITRDGNTVKVNFYIVGTDNMDQIGVKYVYLYERSGYTWSLVKTFSYTDPLYASTMMGSDHAVYAGYLPYSGYVTRSYAASCVFYAEKDGGSDTIPQETPIG